MRITITGCKITPSWTTLQQMLREATKDEHGVLTRINRRDNTADYRALGTYDLIWRTRTEDIPVELDIS